MKGDGGTSSTPVVSSKLYHDQATRGDGLDKVYMNDNADNCDNTLRGDDDPPSVRYDEIGSKLHDFKPLSKTGGD